MHSDRFDCRCENAVKIKIYQNPSPIKKFIYTFYLNWNIFFFRKTHLIVNISLNDEHIILMREIKLHHTSQSPTTDSFKDSKERIKKICLWIYLLNKNVYYCFLINDSAIFLWDTFMIHKTENVFQLNVYQRIFLFREMYSSFFFVFNV